MSNAWLRQFGIYRKTNAVTLQNEVFPSHGAIESVRRRCLLHFPLSSPTARYRNIYSAYPSCSEKEKSEGIRLYEKHCRTDIQVRYRQKPKIIKKKGQPRRRRIKRTLHDVLDTVPKKRIGPSLRTLALNFEVTSPHFRYFLSVQDRKARMRDLEWGINKSARHLARRLKNCSVIVDRLNSMMVEVHSREWRVNIKRITTEDVSTIHQPRISIDRLADDVSTIHQPRILIDRLTDDQIATAHVLPEKPVLHDSLVVRLYRIDNMNSIRRCTCNNGLSMCIDCRLILSKYGFKMKSHCSQQSSLDIEQSIFLIPDLPHQQKIDLLDPEEIRLPDQVSSLNGDIESGDSYEVASIASSSATSIMQPSEIPYNGSRYTKTESVRRQSLAPPKRLQLLRTASCPLSVSEMKSKREFVAANVELSQLCESARKHRRDSFGSGIISRSSKRPLINRDSPVLTRNSSRSLTKGIMIFEKRSRSGMC